MFALNRIPLVAIVSTLAITTLLLFILFGLGVPMAGTWNALIATILAGGMTVVLAYIFAHGART